LAQKGATFLLNDIREDLKVAMACVSVRPLWVKISRFLLKPGIWAVIGYRLGRRLYLFRNLPSRLILMLYMFLIMLPLKLMTGIEIYPETKIGAGFYIEHYGTIFIAPTAKIGRNCTIFQGVTIGADLGGHKAGVIGDNVIIAAGAKVIGDITVGSNVIIGANSVVIRDVPDNTVVAGVPAVVIRKL
jgi:serine O-acetyltransferase